MERRSIVRRTSTAARHALLKEKKRKNLKNQIKELELKTRKSKMKRDLLLSGGRLFRNFERVEDQLGGKLSAEISNRRGALQDMASDIGAKQSKQEIALKRKQKQLKVLKRKIKEKDKKAK